MFELHPINFLISFLDLNKQACESICFMLDSPADSMSLLLTNPFCKCSIKIIRALRRLDDDDDDD